MEVTTEKLTSIDPATREVIAEFAAASPAELAAALERARRAQPEWAALPVRERVAYLRRLRELLYVRRREVAEVITRENGKPRIEALLPEVMVSLDAISYYAGHAERFLAPHYVPHANPALKAKRGILWQEPYGVIGIISPWNYPLAIPMSQLVPALLAGNAVVLKPSELTPWTATTMTELIRAAGIPAGVFELVLGDGALGAALVTAGIDKLIFTGSVATGKKVMAAAAERLLPVVVELGGKDPMVVLADADLAVASSGAVWAGFTNCGQACISVERVYVEQPIADRFIEQCVVKTKKLRLGNGLDPDVEIGPMIRERQVRVVEEQLEDAVRQGARILCGGRRREDLGGFFFEPTVVTGVHHGMRLMREETFGPVLPIQVVADAEEAIALANDSDFGLAASLWTRDRRRARTLAARFQCGAVMVNDAMSYYAVCEAPHGGTKASGFGRTHSRLGLAEMVRVKYLDTDRLPHMRKFWWFGYDAELAEHVEGFFSFLYDRDWRRRLRGLAASMRSVWRKSRI